MQTLPAVNKPEPKRVIVMGDERVAVRLDSGGFLRRTTRTIRLRLRTDLYIAKDVGPQSKVAPQYDAYAKIVTGMGGTLTCPAAIVLPETGQKVANPIVTTYEDSAVIRRVEALALCAVRNPMTGQYSISVGRIIVDTEQVFRQALLKLEHRDDAIEYVSRAEYDARKAAGELKGWGYLASGPIGIAYNLRNPAVKGCFQTFTEQSATARQRAMTKAKRLAGDHNPVTRLVAEKGMLSEDPQGGAPFLDLTVVAWIEPRDEEQAKKILDAIAENVDDIDGVGQVVRVEGRDEEDEEIDDLQPDEASDARLLPDHGERPPVIEPAPVKEKVETKPVEKPAAKAGDAGGPMAEIAKLEALASPPEIVGALRAEAGIKVLAEATPAQLTAYLTALRAEVA